MITQDSAPPISLTLQTALYLSLYIRPCLPLSREIFKACYPCKRKQNENYSFIHLEYAALFQRKCEYICMWVLIKLCKINILEAE